MSATVKRVLAILLLVLVVGAVAVGIITGEWMFYIVALIVAFVFTWVIKREDKEKEKPPAEKFPDLDDGEEKK